MEIIGIKYSLQGYSNIIRYNPITFDIISFINNIQQNYNNLEYRRRNY